MDFLKQSLLVIPMILASSPPFDSEEPLMVSVFHSANKADLFSHRPGVLPAWLPSVQKLAGRDGGATRTASPETAPQKAIGTALPGFALAI